MKKLNRVIIIIVCLQIQLSGTQNPCFSQITQSGAEAANIALNADQEAALNILDQSDTISLSDVWPNIKPSLFFANIRNNILHPTKINQGKGTNFCAYASLTHILLRYKPQLYVTEIISLYRTGSVNLYKGSIRPSERVRKAAGTLKHRGELDILHADQLWFLSMADKFKGYLNIFDNNYNTGDETAIWASTNYGKFNKMLRQFGKFELEAAGSDLVRPHSPNFYEFITTQLQAGVVLLYINGKYLHPSRYTVFTIRAPSHFIVLYDMRQVGDLINIKYWDYGLKTEQLITKKRLRKLIFGVTLLHN